MEKFVLVIIIAVLFLAAPFVIQGIDLLTPNNDPVPTETAVPIDKTEAETQDSNTAVIVDKYDYSSCLEKDNSAEKNFCIRDKAIGFNDPIGCDLADEFYRVECTKAYALGVSSIEACEAIVDEQIRFECFSELGKEENNESFCLKIPISENNRLRGTCLKDVAFDNEDPGVCVQINFFSLDGEVVRDACIENFYGTLEDSELCDSVSNADSKQTCIESVAKNTNSISLCQSLDDEIRADDCLFYLGTEFENQGACDVIANESIATTCVDEITQLTGSEKCFAKETNLEQNNCLKDIALEENSAELCKSIETDFGVRSQCYSALAIETGDGDLCFKIIKNDFELIDGCFLAVAVKSTDAGFCENILSPVKYLDCFASVASELNEISICNLPEKQVISSYSKYNIDNLCIKSFSVKNSDTTYCDRITQEDLKAACHDLNSTFR